jgi:tetratricopeptide (TPR) repeat protein
MNTNVRTSFGRRHHRAARKTRRGMARMTKQSRNLTWWSLAGIAGAALATGMVWRHRAAERLLPESGHYGTLPAAFDQALQDARNRAGAPEARPDDWRRLARLYQANRLDREARQCYEVIAATPAGLSPRDHYYLAELALREGELEAAQVELGKVVAAQPDYLPARLSLAEAFFKTGRDDQAATQYREILAIEANQPQALFGLARIELQRGNDDEAVAHLEDLMASHPESTSGAALFAQVLDRRGETDRAVAMTEWSRQKPEPIMADPWLDELLADCYDRQRLALKFEDYAKTGQMDRAVPLLHRVAELDPSSPVPALLRGWSEAQMHHDDEAVKEYGEALAKGGDPEKICPYLVQSLLTLGRTGEAAKLMAGYYTKMPDSIPILSAYADVAVRLHDDPLSRTLLTRVLQKEPYLYAANVSLGKILWAAGERDAAAQCLERIAVVYAGDVASRALLGEYYLGKSNPVAAIKPLEQAIGQARPQAPVYHSLTAMLSTAYLQAGNAGMVRGDFAAAGGYFDRAIRLAPTDPNGYAGKAGAAVQLKQWKPAADALARLAALQPDNPTIYLSLGDVRYQDGEEEQARHDWQKARQLTGTGDAALRDALDQRLDGRITAETFK